MSLLKNELILSWRVLLRGCLIGRLAGEMSRPLDWAWNCLNEGIMDPAEEAFEDCCDTIPPGLETLRRGSFIWISLRAESVGAVD